MLEYAYDKNGELIQIEDAISGQGYTCPECGDKLTTKNRRFDGRKKEYHFAHKSGAECAALHTGESDTHRNTKFLAYQVLHNAFKTGKYLIRWRAYDEKYCYSFEDDILKNIDEIVMEKRTISKFIPDISLKSHGRLLRVVEIEYKHKDTDEKTAEYRENKIEVIRIDTDEELYKKMKLTKKIVMNVKLYSHRLVLMKSFGYKTNLKTY